MDISLASVECAPHRRRYDYNLNFVKYFYCLELSFVRINKMPDILCILFVCFISLSKYYRLTQAQIGFGFGFRFGVPIDGWTVSKYIHWVSLGNVCQHFQGQERRAELGNSGYVIIIGVHIGIYV